MERLNKKLYKEFKNENDLIYDVEYLTINSDYTYNVLLGKVDDFTDVKYFCEISHNGELIYPRVLS